MSKICKLNSIFHKFYVFLINLKIKKKKRIILIIIIPTLFSASKTLALFHKFNNNVFLINLKIKKKKRIILIIIIPTLFSNEVKLSPLLILFKNYNLQWHYLKCIKN